ncbi:PLP-dependent transferase [Hypoxylon trugodes]|uniref:PLP-dependent transferase n=1 Tax=Hypoxylon trugodes TaxID=326681 RepID=UPI00219F7C26|nr:PLP-dependent transferase [Hypoxylon trugodes]KAI1387947.1 PLP-dependent transferase [Hypoxylon trugodes]
MTENRGQLESILGALLARRKSQSKLRMLNIAPGSSVDFSSNGYLSLSTNLAVQKALLCRLEAQVAESNSPGSRKSILGSGGSRLLDGNSSFAEALEAKIANFHKSEAALLFTSAYDANTGLLGCVPQPGDVIVYDELIHASVHEGMRISRAAKRIPFAHDSVSATHYSQNAGNRIKKPSRQSKNQGLDDVLKQLSSDERVARGKTNVFICVEGLYSMDGDIPLLEDIVKAVDRRLPSRNGYIIVDEAHSVGTFGDKGRGLVCQLGLEDRVWARVIGFGKALGCAGGVVLCSSTTRSYLINYARSLIYTTSMAFTSLASIDVVYDYLISGQSDLSRHNLEALIRYTHRQLYALYTHLHPDRSILHVDETPFRSPIIPIFTIYPRDLAGHCQRSGFMVRPIVAPTVPAGSERVRVCLHSANTKEQVDGLCTAIEVWVQSRVVATSETRDNYLEATNVLTKQDKPQL